MSLLLAAASGAAAAEQTVDQLGGPAARLEALHLARAGRLEALRRALVGLHLRHCSSRLFGRQNHRHGLAFEPAREVAERLAAVRDAHGGESIVYYGGGVLEAAAEKPKCPVQLHFGEKDAGIPLTDVETIKAKRPDVEVHIYPGAQHGFHCDERASYDKTSADIAWPRSLAFFAKHLTK